MIFLINVDIVELKKEIIKVLFYTRRSISVPKIAGLFSLVEGQFSKVYEALNILVAEDMVYKVKIGKDSYRITRRGREQFLSYNEVNHMYMFVNPSLCSEGVRFYE